MNLTPKLITILLLSLVTWSWNFTEIALLKLCQSGWVVRELPAKQALRARAQKVEISADPNNPDVSDDDDEEEDESAPQLVEEDSMDVDNGPVIDDDGFELVQRKGRRR